MKRLFALLLAMLLLTGCTGRQPETPEEPAEVIVEETEPEKEPPVEEPEEPAEEPEAAPELPAEPAEEPEEPAPAEVPEEIFPLEREITHVDGMVEDAVAFDLEVPVFSGVDGAQSINTYYEELAAHLENHTRDTVYLKVMEMHTMANVYGVVYSLNWNAEWVEVEYQYRVEYLNDTEPEEFFRTDRFDLTTGEPIPVS